MIVHELAHLVVAEHSPEFYAIVNRNPYAERAEGYLLALSDMGGAASEESEEAEAEEAEAEEAEAEALAS